MELIELVILGDIVLATEQLDCKETEVVGVDVGTKGRLSVFSNSEGSDDPIIALSDSVFPLILNTCEYHLKF